MKYNFKIRSGLISLFLILHFSFVHAQYAYQSMIGPMGSDNGRFYAPSAVAVDASGNVYVADAGNNRIQVFNNSNGYVTKWGSPGNGNNQFNYPTGIAVDPSGYVYVVDQNNHRVQKFNNSGNYQSTIGGPGNVNGSFQSPSGISIDASGNIYVADAGNNRVQKFNSSGGHVWSSGSQGTGNDNFDYPTGVAVDGSGNVYVADQNNNRIKKLNSNGTYSNQWGSLGSNHNQLRRPTGLSLDASGNIFVLDGGNDRIEIFTVGGVYLNTIGSYGTSISKFNYATGIEWKSGKLYVADQNNYRVQIFSQTAQACSACTGQGYTYSHQWGSYGSDDGETIVPQELTVDKLGNVYVLDTYNRRIQKFSSDGTFITKWGGTYGIGDNEFALPTGIAVDASGNVFVCDMNNHRVQQFTSTGTFVRKWGSNGTANGDFTSPTEVTVDASGNVYVVDAHRVQKFSNTGAYITHWNIGGSIVAEANDRGIAVDLSGNVFVSFQYDNIIKKYSSSGSLITSWGSSGTSNGEFDGPNTIAIDGSGDLFIVDYGNSRVQKFTNNGTYISQWGTYGLTGNSEFNQPRGIAVDNNCNVYVLDSHNDRVKVFSPNISIPTISSFTPTSGYGGTRVTITGTNLTGVSSVSFNGTQANLFTINSSTEITVVAPIAVSSGPISISKCGSFLSSSNFAAVPCDAGTTYSYSSQWGEPGSDPGDFDFAGSNSYIGIDGTGNIYVFDDGNERVQKFSSIGTYITEWNTGLIGSLAVDLDGNVYVSRYDLHKVRKYNTSSANHVLEIGGQGTGDGQFNSPDKLAVDGLGNLYVSDLTTRLQKFNSQGAYQSQFSISNLNGDLIGGIDIDGSGNVFILSGVGITNTGYINMYNYLGTPVANYTVGPILFGLAVDGAGNLYMGGNGYTVYKISSNGTSITSWGSSGTGDGELQAPIGVAVDMGCNAYVLDYWNSRIQLFDLNNGLRKASKIIPVNGLNEKAKISVYPNPGQGEFTISAPGKLQFDLVLYNSLGQEVLRESAIGENHTISDPSLAEGIYNLHVMHGGETNKLKLVVIK